MLYKNVLASFITLVWVGVLSGCAELNKDSETAPDGSLPVIQLQAPTDNSIFTSGNTISIKSTISDKDRIKEMEVQVVKVIQGSTSEAIWGYKKFPTTNPVIVDTSMNTTGLTSGHYMVRFNLVDTRTNAQVKEVHFLIR
ncbi:Ig-like domain-containing protein [Adhaeribacter pallidiroseus]|uniref:Uncharacterized protein n=1 Tax=Adhaeribacter pallidiroseus TaxID=2072847 RepID=A0A369QHL6_9BACT|nr:Ig-like domain-containing protein [Adhaeribacter pallidiroseus]RDC63922.1 hypothetical protein AHMF7616_02531 [Adhaeribacter pallidiroseus]